MIKLDISKKIMSKRHKAGIVTVLLTMTIIKTAGEVATHPGYPVYNSRVCLTASPSREYRFTTSNTDLITSEQMTLTLQCPTNHMIRLTQLFYGYGQNGSCDFRSTDCVMDVANSKVEKLRCVGMTSCLIRIPQEELRSEVIPSCRMSSSYIRVHYQCIPETDSVNICNGQGLTSARGYLLTPGYPFNYSNNLNCSFRLQAPLPLQRFRLFVVDFDLELNGTGCADSFQLSDGYRDSTMCSVRSRVSLRSSMSHYINVKFITNQGTTCKGFWIYYEAYPVMNATQTKSPTSGRRTGMTKTPSLQDLPQANDQVISPIRQRDHLLLNTAASELDRHNETNRQVLHVHTGYTQMQLEALLCTAVVLLFCSVLVLLLVIYLKRSTGRRQRTATATSIESSTISYQYIKHLNSIESKNNLDKVALREHRQRRAKLNNSSDLSIRSSGSQFNSLDGGNCNLFYSPDVDGSDGLPNNSDSNHFSDKNHCTEQLYHY